jgi:hypothetical protein
MTNTTTCVQFIHDADAPAHTAQIRQCRNIGSWWVDREHGKAVCGAHRRAYDVEPVR